MGTGEMTGTGPITSTSNPRVRSALRLYKKHERDGTGLMIVEGIREISRALDGGVEIIEVFHCPGIASGGEARSLGGRLAATGAAMTEVSDRVFGKLAYRGDSGGFLAVARRPHPSLDSLPRRPGALVLVIDAIEKPGNLGALFRSADGAGATGVIISGMKTDLFNPNVIRSSLGSVFTVPAAVATPEQGVDWLRAAGVSIVAAVPGADTLYTDARLDGPCAIVVGSEDLGVSSHWMSSADLRVRIPMMGAVDSLNVSVSASILLYEAHRQRSAKSCRA